MPEPETEGTFTVEQHRYLFNAFADSFSVAQLEQLYHASYDRSFAASLRALLRSVVEPHVADGWDL